MNEIKQWLESEDKDFETGLRLLSKHGRNRALVSNLGRKQSQFNQDKLAYELGKIELPAEPEVAVEPDDLRPLYKLNGEYRIVMVDAIAHGVEHQQLNELYDGLLAKQEVIKEPVAPAPDSALTNETGSTLPNEPAPDSAPANEPDSTLPNEPAPDSAPANDLPTVNEPVNPLDGLIAEMQRLFQERVRLSNTLADMETDEARESVAAQVLAHQNAYNALAVKKSYFEEHGKFPEAPAAAPAPDATNDKSELLQVRNNLRSQRTKAKTALLNKPEDVVKQEKLAKIEIELGAVEAKIKLLS